MVDTSFSKDYVSTKSGQLQTDAMKAAALYAGTVTGMALVCNLDTESVSQSYKAFLQHHKARLLAEDQQVLLNLNAEGIGIGMKMQTARGAIPCSEVGGKLLEAIERLRSA
jgi:hypothetical protein